MVMERRLTCEISKKDDPNLKKEIEDRIQTKQIYCGLGVMELVSLANRVTQNSRSESPRLLGVGFFVHHKFENIW